MTVVRTRDEAIALVDHALQAWSTDSSGVLMQAHSAVRAACDQAEDVVRQRANEAAAIEAHLSFADPDKRRDLQAQLVRAKEATEKAKRASAQIRDVAAGVAQLSRTHTTMTSTLVASARSQLSAMSRALEGYRSGGAVFGGGTIGSGTAKSAPNSLGGSGLSEVDVGAADLAENPVLDGNSSQRTFGKGGLSRADYRWAVQTWNDTVGPGVAKGKTRDDFAARDAQSKAKPLRRTADVYDLFLGSDRIRADRQADGSLNIINGRHHLLVARELGITHLPGDVH